MSAPIFSWILDCSFWSLFETGKTKPVVVLWQDHSGWAWNTFYSDRLSKGNQDGGTLDEARAAALAHAQRLGVVPVDAEIEVES